jgi:PPOX class probable F420-dependent enzyme
MDKAKAREFLRSRHRGVLAARRVDGSPQLSPVSCALDRDGNVVVSTRETAMKTKNIRRDPRVSLVVMDDGFFGEWIQIDGTARIVSLPEAMEGLVDYYRTAAGEHPNWDEYREAMERERRVLLVISMDRVGPDRSG